MFYCIVVGATEKSSKSWFTFSAGIVQFIYFFNAALFGFITDKTWSFKGKTVCYLQSTYPLPMLTSKARESMKRTRGSTSSGWVKGSRWILGSRSFVMKIAKGSTCSGWNEGWVKSARGSTSSGLFKSTSWQIGSRSWRIKSARWPEGPWSKRVKGTSWPGDSWYERVKSTRRVECCLALFGGEKIKCKTKDWNFFSKW